MSELSQSDLIYDLSAVLIHKGTGANSGHYIAHIKDVNTGQWWEFDDENVTYLGYHPFGEGSSSSKQKSIKTDAVHFNSSKAKVADSNGNGLNVSHSQSSLVETFLSTDAYMLMYHLKHTKKVGESGRSGTCEGVEVALQNGASLPSHLCDEIQNFNVSYEGACKDYNNRKELALGRITGRREEVRSVLAEAPVQPLEQPFYWISSEWLRHWADNIDPMLVLIPFKQLLESS